jgi:hypothetical protein
MAGFYGGRGEDIVKVMTVRLLVYPFTDCVEHVSLDFEGFISQGWVVEDSEDVD